MTGSEGIKHTRRMVASGTQRRRRGQPAQGRRAGRRRSRCSAPSPTRSRRPARTSRWCSCRRGSPRPRSRRHRRGRAAGRGHHRGHPGARHRRVLHAQAQRAGTTRLDRPELPRPDHARASPTPASSRPTSPGPGRIGLVSKSGTLTYQMMYELRDIGFSTARRHRRRPGHRDHAHRLPGRVPGRPGDRRDRDDRRDRRRRRGAGGRLHQGQRDQAGGRLRRRVHRAGGQDDGPRRRDRVRLVRHRRRPSRRRWRRPASGSARRRARPPGWSGRSSPADPPLRGWPRPRRVGCRPVRSRLLREEVHERVRDAPGSDAGVRRGPAAPGRPCRCSSWSAWDSPCWPSSSPSCPGPKPDVRVRTGVDASVDSVNGWNLALPTVATALLLVAAVLVAAPLLSKPAAVDGGRGRPGRLAGAGAARPAWARCSCWSGC